MKVGDTVEDFELLDERGEKRSLSALLENGPVVLFFYPAAFTPGCTAEVCHFRDVAREFGGRVFVCTDQNMVKAGVVEIVLRELAEGKAEYRHPPGG